LILVDGALCYRASGPSRPLAALLVEHFTVFIYDRRGRGDSGDTALYAVEREVEDIQALINEAGGSAFVYGVSSGAALALEAANHGLAVRKLALYEAPFIVDDSRPPIPADFLARLKESIAANRRSGAVKLFLKLVGVPSMFVAMMPLLPAWSRLKAVAHTLPYDITIVQDNQRGKPLPATRWAATRVPTLVMDGTVFLGRAESHVFLHHGAQELANILSHAQRRTLEGQDHGPADEVLAPALKEFFLG